MAEKKLNMKVKETETDVLKSKIISNKMRANEFIESGRCIFLAYIYIYIYLYYSIFAQYLYISIYVNHICRKDQIHKKGESDIIGQASGDF